MCVHGTYSAPYKVSVKGGEEGGEKEEKSHWKDPEVRWERHLCFQEQQRQICQAGYEEQRVVQKTVSDLLIIPHAHVWFSSSWNIHVSAVMRKLFSVCITSSVHSEQMHFHIGEQ